MKKMMKPIASAAVLALGASASAYALTTQSEPERADAQPSANSQTVELPEGGSYILEKTHARLTWSTTHFGFSEYPGGFDVIDAYLTLNPTQPERSTLRMTIDMDSVDSNSEALDTHLRSADFFDTANHPQAEFQSTSVEQTGPTTATITGALTLHGVTKPIELQARFNRAGINPVSELYTVGFTASGTVTRTQFGIDTYAPAVGDDVAINFSGEFVRPK